MTKQQERDLLARIVTEPGKMGGKPIIRGRRITPSMVLKMLANGATRAEVLSAYPVLDEGDIDACLLYAALLSETIASEAPRGYGFAGAALQTSQSYRAQPTLSDGASAVGARVHVAVAFYPGSR